MKMLALRAHHRGPIAKRRATVCKHGHDLTLPDAIYDDLTGKRRCRICKQAENDRRRGQKKNPRAEGSQRKPAESMVPDMARTLALLDLWKQHEHAMPHDRADIRRQIEQLQAS